MPLLVHLNYFNKIKAIHFLKSMCQHKKRNQNILNYYYKSKLDYHMMEIVDNMKGYLL